MSKPLRAFHEKMVDAYIHALEAEIARLRELVESAYHEGWRDSCHYAPDDFSGEGWGISDAKRALEADAESNARKALEATDE